MEENGKRRFFRDLILLYGPGLRIYCADRKNVIYKCKKYMTFSACHDRLE